MHQLVIMTCGSITSLLFTQMSHPLAMGLILILQTLVICLLTGFMVQSFWYSYILFLVFLGGLLVLFIYVTSLASNEMFTLSIKLTLMMSVPLFSLILIYMLVDPSTWLTNLLNNDILSITSVLDYQEESLPSLMKLYNHPTQLITLMLAIYLFLTLIAVVSITAIFQGPLRPSH
uniref:NADH-ubiquinone oxidoreductase chain 6 n=1 Tax=Scopura longa TaxID=2508260 RepID=A0A410PAE7_9NEOP|nr:NADH dehydrogenase subunit 6 [Scopura longa]QAT19802.1 NADH dehydrogenase subunit 6 [Scopura longa]